MALHETDVLRLGLRFSRVACDASRHHSGAPGGLPQETFESLDQTLCFGWIDGIRRRVDDRCYTIRFTPRQPRSVWSTVNTAHVARLMKRGLITRAGLKAFRRRDPARSKLYSYEARSRPLGGAYARTFNANAHAWRFFQAQSPGYRRIATRWVMSAKKEETRSGNGIILAW